MDPPAPTYTTHDPWLLAFLRATPPFDRLPEGVLVKLCERTTRVRLAVGQTLFERGERGDAMYLVVSGRMLTSGESAGTTPAAPLEIGPGRLIGEMQIEVRKPARAPSRSRRPRPQSATA